MTRYEAVHAIYDVINSGILHQELEENLAEAAGCICENSFEQCPAECLRLCKLDECPHAQEWPEEAEDGE